MENFDIAKYLKEHNLGSYGILNHYVDLKPLKEEEKETELDTVIPYEGPEDKLTGLGDGDAFTQDETISEDYEDEVDADIKKMIAHIKDGIGHIDKDYIEQTWEGLSDIPFGNVQKQVVKALYDAGVLSQTPDRIMALGGEQIEQGIITLMDDGFEVADIMELCKMFIRDHFRARARGKQY